MRQQEITTLKVIESLERYPQMTQRDLAKRLKISLGLANTFIQRLIKKGYFEIKAASNSRAKYAITQKGRIEKKRLNRKYIVYLLEFYKETCTKLEEIFNNLIKRGKKKIFLIGVSKLTEIALITLQESSLELAGIVDDKKTGEEFMGNIVLNSSSLNRMPSEYIIIVTIKYSNESVLGQVLTCIAKDDIINLSK